MGLLVLLGPISAYIDSSHDSFLSGSQVRPCPLAVAALGRNVSNEYDYYRPQLSKVFDVVYLVLFD
jgi:hypothetical protein